MTATGPASPADNSIPPGLTERFARELERLWPRGGRLGLAVSGGPDSLAMLLLAQATIPGRFEVATVDHRLRPESAAETAFVADVCAGLAVPCEVLRVTVDKADNLQSAARTARYLALSDWTARRGLSAVATAHHADDQAETLLMRLNRASGVAGLAAVRERSPSPGGGVPLIRPLLGFRRGELQAVVEAAGLDPVRDPSNEDDRFDRVRLRKALAGIDWLDPVALTASAANLADADEALEWATQRVWDEQVTRDESGYRYRPPAPRAIAMRIVERIARSLGNSARGQDVARLLDRLERGQRGNVAGILVTVEGDEWVFQPEPPRRTG